MQLQDFYPIVVTEQLASCRNFYRRWFGLEVAFEASWFVLLSAGAGRKASLAFMHPAHIWWRTMTPNFSMQQTAFGRWRSATQWTQARGGGSRSQASPGTMFLTSWVRHLQESVYSMTPTNLIVRQARPDDQEAIKEVTLAAYSEYAAQIPTHWEKYRENILNTLAKYEPAEQLVAERGDEILGSVLLYPAEIESRPEVRLLAVHPDARSQGIGAALMQECIRRASQAGADALTLHTSDLMRAAVGLYKRLGFVRAPELDFDPAPGLTIKGYRLHLNNATK